MSSSQETKISANNNKKLVCYYFASGLLHVTDIDPFLCTHLIFAFAKFKDGELIEVSPSDIKIYGQMVDLKLKNPALKVMLSVQRGFSELVNSDDDTLKKFYKQAIHYLREYRFDGIDLDWEFPKANEKEKYSRFLKEFRAAITNHSKTSVRPPLLLTAALPNNVRKLENYDIDTLNSTLDFATVMTYDFHMFIKNVDVNTGFNSPLYPAIYERKLSSTVGLMDYYLKTGFSPSKLLVGLPTYGRTWKLKTAENHGVHAPAVGKGDPGSIIHSRGVFTYPEVCLALKNGSNYVWDADSEVPYLYNDLLWCSFEDPRSAANKAKHFLNKCGGVGVWTITFDDAEGKYSKDYQKFPIITAVKNVIMGTENKDSSPVSQPLL
ncbi:acidic mammalian chitinase isoform X2 [Octopus bimaculoides]|uniref:acidic mammalian chitinase isoform X2 n=1 Tax=Octopus bimaculoides TaxID=37653 RepID=UPI0022E3CDE8|nr:acidic mammalian chitinase isoform X2 [Octopus bimaculoides]